MHSNSVLKTGRRIVLRKLKENNVLELRIEVKSLALDRLFKGNRDRDGLGSRADLDAVVAVRLDFGCVLLGGDAEGGYSG